MRRSIVTVATALAALTAVSCEPPPPPAVFTVNSHDPDGDADPGDGVCETAPGNGVCTITAAVEEGNALGKAVIDFPVHTDPYLEPPLDVTTITGDITLRSEFTVYNPAISAAAPNLTVEPGAVLRLEGFTLLARDGLTAEGALLVDRGVLAAETTIAEGGLLFALNSMLLDGGELEPGAAMITNNGTMALRFSYATVPSGSLFHTAAGATSLIGASVLFGPETDACTGTPVTSEGYNIDWTGLETGYRVWVDRCTDDPAPSDEEDEAVPHGVLGCGTTVTVDNLGAPRPVDDDDDGTARCGAGAIESNWG